MTLSERMESKIEKITESGCFIWLASTTRCGYGQIRVNKKNLSAHRVAYEIARGPIPQGLDLDHLCRVRCCVNPDHLEPVTRFENSIRGERATRTHCPRGHEYTDSNTYYHRRGHQSHRICRVCNRLHVAKYKQKAQVPND